LRTNWMEPDPKTLWDTYIQLTEVEDAFRTAKDLGMAADLSSKRRPDPSPYSGLLSFADPVADTATMKQMTGKIGNKGHSTEVKALKTDIGLGQRF